MKRAFDIVVSVVALIFLLPLMLAIAIAILLTMGRPVLFRQIRPGLNARAFQMLKFRTMTSDTDADGNALDDGARITALGHFLRQTSMDELPELWNVAKGDMSLVGPRPLLMEYVPLYSPRQHRRHETRPGITGWAQVNGRNMLSWDEKFELDIWYVENRSMLMDLLIMTITIFKVLKRDDISATGDATMPKFTGSLNDTSNRAENS